MTKDEMKNRISMALKDPILQQGFEIICKENAELKEQIALMQDAEAEQFIKDKGCPDCFCEDCTKNCGIKELGARAGTTALIGK